MPWIWVIHVAGIALTGSRLPHSVGSPRPSMALPHSTAHIVLRQCQRQLQSAVSAFAGRRIPPRAWGSNRARDMPSCECGFPGTNLVVCQISATRIGQAHLRLEPHALRWACPTRSLTSCGCQRQLQSAVSAFAGRRIPPRAWGSNRARDMPSCECGFPGTNLVVCQISALESGRPTCGWNPTPFDGPAPLDRSHRAVSWGVKDSYKARCQRSQGGVSLRGRGVPTERGICRPANAVSPARTWWCARYPRPNRAARI